MQTEHATPWTTLVNCSQTNVDRESYSKLNNFLGWGEVRLGEVKQEPFLVGELQGKVPVSLHC